MPACCARPAVSRTLDAMPAGVEPRGPDGACSTACSSADAVFSDLRADHVPHCRATVQLPHIPGHSGQLSNAAMSLAISADESACHRHSNRTVSTEDASASRAGEHSMMMYDAGSVAFRAAHPVVCVSFNGLHGRSACAGGTVPGNEYTFIRGPKSSGPLCARAGLGTVGRRSAKRHHGFYFF